MKKQLLTPKRAEKIQRQIYYNMSDEKRLDLFFKINEKVHKVAIEKTTLKYPNIKRISVSFVDRLYQDIDSERNYYDNLFNKLFTEELKLVK